MFPLCHDTGTVLPKFRDSAQTSQNHGYSAELLSDCSGGTSVLSAMQYKVS